MIAPPVSASGRLGPKLAWFDGRSGWRHGMHLVLVLVGAAVIWWGDQVLTLGQQAGIWGLMVIVQVLRLRWLWRPFFGAVFFFELIRTARGGRHVWLRCAYASVLLIAL